MELGDVAYGSSADGQRFLHASIPAFGWEIGAAYVPNTAPRSTAKQDMWRFLTDTVAPAFRERRSLLSGDFNTGLPYRDELGKTLQGALDMQRLLDSGWRDAWATVNPVDQRPPASWWSTIGNPFRLDHCFLAPAAPNPISVEYPTQISGVATVSPDCLSDHTPLIVDFTH